jgi:hypothetical protein
VTTPPAACHNSDQTPAANHPPAHETSRSLTVATGRRPPKRVARRLARVRQRCPLGWRRATPRPATADQWDTLIQRGGWMPTRCVWHRAKIGGATPEASTTERMTERRSQPSPTAVRSPAVRRPSATPLRPSRHSETDTAPACARRRSRRNIGRNAQPYPGWQHTAETDSAVPKQ